MIEVCSEQAKTWNQLKMNRLFVFAFFAAVLCAVTESLDPQNFQEGSCVQYKPQQNFNTTWLANTVLPYISGGSRYQLYRLASGHPQFINMREFEFNYESCLQSYVNSTTGVGLVYGFGIGVIANFDVRYTDQKGVFDFVPLPTPGMEDISRQYVTLTDNKSFVVFANCWTGSNQRGWFVMSLTPTLDTKTQKLIEDHVKSLGFDREQFVFLRYNGCSTTGPVPGSAIFNPSVGSKTSVAGLHAERMMRLRSSPVFKGF